MAVSQKRNEEYWALKARIDKWGIWFGFGPLWTIVPLALIGAILTSRLFQEPVVGGFLGFVLGVTLLFYFTKKKIGFLVESQESCQNCGISMAQVRGIATLDYLCRQCGNNNSLYLHDT